MLRHSVSSPELEKNIKDSAHEAASRGVESNVVELGYGCHS